MAKHTPKPEAPFLQHLKDRQLRVIAWLDRRQRTLLAILFATGVCGIAGLQLLGARLLPDFRENYLIAHASLRSGVSIAETARVGRRICQGLLAIPGVKSVAEQIGRAENGQDPDAPNKSEFEVQIDPQEHHDATEIDAAIRKVFQQYPNELIEINSVLAERIGETLSGESAPFSVSIIGSDLDADDRVGEQILEVLRKLPHSGNVRLVVPPRQAELQITLQPERLALYGLQAADVLESVNAAYHGRVAAELSQADRSLPVVVRVSGAATNPHELGMLLLRGRDGALTSLASVATIEMASARSLIDHEDGLRRQIVVASPATANQTGYADAARKAIAAKVELPPGIYLRYGGVAEAQRSAANELLLHSAAAFVLIVLLQTALRGAHERLTPVLLTALLTALALLPVALQLHQPGHEIEGPMAVVILGGLGSSTLVSLLLIPPLAVRWLRHV